MRHVSMRLSRTLRCWGTQQTVATVTRDALPVAPLMTLFLIRHATAGVRDHANPNDDQRPLDPFGLGQAAAIADLLADEPIEAVLSSGALRCHQTVAPLAERLGLAVEHAAQLFEGQSRSSSIEFVRSFTGRTVALCSHGDVIPDVLRNLEVGGSRLEGRGCAKGSIWRLDNSTDRIETADYLGSIDPPS